MNGPLQDPIRALSIGSCLSRYSLNALARIHATAILGCVYHNRADRFIRHYIQCSEPEPDAEVLARLEPAAGAEHRLRIMLENQLSSHSLGKYALYNCGGFMPAIREKIDLIVADNFVDLVARLGNRSLFLLEKDLANRTALAMEPHLLPIHDAMDSWRAVLAWLRHMQPEATILFLNFPFHHHPNSEIAERARQFAAEFKSDDAIVLPDFPVHPTLIESPSHFAQAHYALYAGAILTGMNASEHTNAADEDFDAVLRA